MNAVRAFPSSSPNQFACKSQERSLSSECHPSKLQMPLGFRCSQNFTGKGRRNLRKIIMTPKKGSLFRPLENIELTQWQKPDYRFPSHKSKLLMDDPNIRKLNENCGPFGCAYDSVETAFLQNCWLVVTIEESIMLWRFLLFVFGLMFSCLWHGSVKRFPSRIVKICVPVCFCDGALARLFFV